jgi:hypothetical protein
MSRLQLQQHLWKLIHSVLLLHNYAYASKSFEGTTRNILIASRTTHL